MSEIVSLKSASAVPHAIEAEQAVLGAILLGQTCDDVQSLGGAGIFFDPVHAELYRVCLRLERAGKMVSPITVKASLSDELVEGLSHLGGVGYIVRLAAAAIAPKFVAEYAGILAEEKAKRDLLSVIGDAQSQIAKGDMSASDVAAKMEAGFSVLAGGSSRVSTVSMMSAVTDAMEEIYAAHNGEERNVVSSGIGAVDRFVPGFAPGEMWLIGGRPSMGKTAVALSMGLNAARAGHPVVIASLEMTPQAMATRALSEATARQRSATSYKMLRMGQFTESQSDALMKAAAEVAQLPITFLPREYQDADLLQAGVKQTLRRVRGDKLPVLIVDYAQLMRSKAKTRYEQITDISLALKGLAMSLGIPVIALSQLSRALEQRDDKRPIMSDLRESGQLEQDADGVMFCFREEYYTEREEPPMDDIEAHEAWSGAMQAQKNKLEIIIAKQRQGDIGTAHVMFNPALNLVWER